MKKLIIIFLFLPCIVLAGITDTHKRVIAQKRIESSGVTCSGAIQDGDNESFEKGSGLFCTTGPIETDTEGVIDTYSTDQSNCGTHGLKIAPHTTIFSKVSIPITDATAFTTRHYLYIPTATGDFESFSEMYFVDAGLNIDERITVNHTTGASYTLYFLSDASSYFSPLENTWYYYEVEWDGSGTVNGTTLKLFNVAGAAQTATNGTDATTIASTQDDGVSYFEFPTDAEETHYIDDFIYSSTSADLTGVQTCD